MRTIAFCLVVGLALTSGCSISNSISKSVESVSDSISALSPSGGDEKSLYHEDVQAYAAVFATDPGTDREFLRGIGRVAERHGITNWESDPETLLLAGRGLHRGGMSGDDVDELSSGIAEVDSASARLLVEGYESVAQ